MLVLCSFQCSYIIFLNRNGDSNVMCEPRGKVMLTLRCIVSLSENSKLVIKKNTQRRDLSGKISGEKWMRSLKLRKNHFKFELRK